MSKHVANNFLCLSMPPRGLLYIYIHFINERKKEIACENDAFFMEFYSDMIRDKSVKFVGYCIGG